MPVGAILAGVSAAAVGLRPSLTVAALGMLASTLWLALSPVRTAAGDLDDL